MSNTNPLEPVACAPRWFVWLGVLALAAFALFLARNTSVAAAGSDSSGYLNSGRLLAAGHWQTALRTPPEFGPQMELNRAHFTPHGFFPQPGNPHLPPTYPPGLPLHYALAGKILGWEIGPLVVGLAGALGALWLLYATSRELGLDPWLAAAGASALGACPVFLFTSIQPLSDTLATAWALATFYTALRARRHAGWAAACGAATAVAVLVRPTNLVMLPALVVLLGLDWRRLGLATLAGLPGAVWLALYNRELYGGPMRSGYGDWQAAFSWSYAPPTLAHFAQWLPLLLPGVLVVLALAAAVRRDFRTRGLLALGLWFAAVVGLYACYEVSREAWWCLRFILPGIPALILAGLLGADAVVRSFAIQRAQRWRAIAAVILGLWAVGGSCYWTKKLGVLYTKGYEEAYAKACVAARGQLPANALVTCFYLSGAIYHYTDFAVLRWDQIEAAQFARYAALAQTSGRPVCAVIFVMEEQGALRERCPGNWTKIGTSNQISFWRLDGLNSTSAK